MRFLRLIVVTTAVLVWSPSARAQIISTGPDRRGGRRMFGGGLYRYGSRPASTGFAVPASPGTIAATAFANSSIGVGAGLSIDLSFWYTAKDKNCRTISSVRKAIFGR
jgi:hypothetical protein